MTRAPVVALCVAALAAGCGARSSPSPSVDVPAGFTVRVVKDQGFSIALPTHWRSLEAHEALSSAAMKRFRRSNPQLGSALQALALPNSPIKLLAVGPASESGFLTNLNVLVTRIPSQISFDEWKRTEAAEIKTVGAVRDLTEEETQLPPGRALHLTYHASFRHPGGSYTAFVHQYFVRNEGFLYVLTYTTLPSSEPRYRRTFADSAHTFQLIG